MGFLKSSKRSKWYKCFRTEKHENYPFEPVGGKGKESNILRQNMLMTLSDENLDSLSDSENDSLSKKSKSCRSFARAVKAVLFTTSLSKKKRGKKSEEERSFRSNSSISSKLEKIFSFRDKKSSSSSSSRKNKYDRSPRGSSSFSSYTTSSLSSQSPSPSPSPSIASNSRSSSERKRSIAIDLKQPEKKPTTHSKRSNNECFISAAGLYFLLMCLVPLVFWGKAFAIFCTSTCLFLVPRCLKIEGVDQSHSVHNSVHSIDIDSDEYKKKVIMEGLLERNRTTRVL